MSPYEIEHQAIVRWFDNQAKKYPRSDYAAWCSYFKAQIQSREYKDSAYWQTTGTLPQPPEHTK